MSNNADDGTTAEVIPLPRRLSPPPTDPDPNPDDDPAAA